jgi:hypothetical protein
MVENERQRAKTAFPIRRRPVASRRAVSQSQPSAQGLNQLAEAANMAEPANIPPPSAQDTASSSSNDNLLPVGRIAARAHARRSPCLSTDRDTPEDVYWIDWIVYLNKEIFHSDMIASSHWDIKQLSRAAVERIETTLEARGKDEKLARSITRIPVSINVKEMKALQLTVLQPFQQDPWGDVDYHVLRLRRQERSDIRVSYTMKYEVEEQVVVVPTRTPVQPDKQASKRETATQR